MNDMQADYRTYLHYIVSASQQDINQQLQMRNSGTITIILLALACLSRSLPSRAKYVQQPGRPLNIANQGLCSIFPENTVEAFQAALYQGADFIELDVVLTKENVPLVIHDPYLSRLTNIKNRTELVDRQSKRKYNGAERTDWWTDNFTLAELGELRVKQDQATGRISRFDFKFAIPTLDQVVKMVLAFNELHQGKRNPDGRLAGILIEAKDPQMYRDLYNIEIGEQILQILRANGVDSIARAEHKCPVYLQTLDLNTVKYWAAYTELPRNYLLTNTMPFNLEEINRYANGIGYNDKMVWDYFLSCPTWLLEETRKYELLIHVWTFRDDAKIFQAVDSIQMYQIAQLQMKLDGVITENSDAYASISQLLRNGRRPHNQFNI